MSDEVRDELDNTMFASVGRVHEEPSDTSDQELIRLIYAYFQDDAHLTETEDGQLLDIESLSSMGLATFTLRERDYDVDEGEDGAVVVRDEDENVTEPEPLY